MASENYLNPQKAKVLYQQLVDGGYDKKNAAKRVQKETGISPVTWKPMKSKEGVMQSTAGVSTPGSSIPSGSFKGMIN